VVRGTTIRQSSKKDIKMIKRALILAEATGGDYASNLRSAGATEIKARLKRRGWETELIENTFYWRDSDGDLLNRTLDTFFNNKGEKLLALSAPILRSFGLDMEDTLKYVRKKFPDIKIIIGGVRHVKFDQDDFYCKYFDGVFMGRSMEMFEEFLDGGNMVRFRKLEGKPYFLNTLYNYDYERPIVTDLLEENDFLSEKDVIGFELGLGCKFNCSFCDYPLRNSKKLYLSSEDAIVHALQSAYDRFGIKSFFVADDTVNEADEKLELLQRAVRRLSFTPNLGGFMRMDVLSRRPHQLEMLKEINFVSYLFGVETFNDEASKLIRKKHSPKSVEQTIKELKKVIPHAWTGISVIGGLEHDNLGDLVSMIKHLTSSGLVDNIDMSPLVIKNKDDYLIVDEGFFSDMDLYPEKFGYKMKDGNWTNSTTSEEDVRKDYWTMLFDYLHDNNFINFNGFVYLNVLSFGLADQFEPNSSVRRKFTEEGLFKIFKARLKRQISSYVIKKFNQIQKDYGT